ncbi:uncharacterized protein PHALS_10320 [Plasmopara halstedii]|uniref:Uncharacterized protein n=1 Tax=Plasmopara halstedii TaxID=4781 RepID=A0A0P1AHY7_PLAHL|nr:uncharacterized protein PHALS_10320 [Plasmopara halstedii]CEG40102.1 hypothetical protein PHALS_10320 [Plasmopara halstedii]|eukprot:XP_024576471.1 hypothetical protein PHALS_10320 [Plasmopara halstedii]
MTDTSPGGKPPPDPAPIMNSSIVAAKSHEFTTAAEPHEIHGSAFSIKDYQ